MEVVKEAREFLRQADLETARSDIKLFFLFRYDKRRFTLRELALILYPNKIDIDGVTKETKPSHESLLQTGDAIAESRSHLQEHKSVLIYYIRDEKTGNWYYRNVTTLELYELIEKRVDKMMKGFKDMRKIIHEILGVSKEEKQKLAKKYADRIRREQMEKIKKQLDAQRQKELEEIHAAKEKQRAEQEEEEEV
jgi:hypothetical protein